MTSVIPYKKYRVLQLNIAAKGQTTFSIRNAFQAIFLFANNSEAYGYGRIVRVSTNGGIVVVENVRNDGSYAGYCPRLSFVYNSTDQTVTVANDGAWGCILNVALF